jgi:hypothetical protein
MLYRIEGWRGKQDDDYARPDRVKLPVFYLSDEDNRIFSSEDAERVALELLCEIIPHRDRRHYKQIEQLSFKATAIVDRYGRAGVAS